MWRRLSGVLLLALLVPSFCFSGELSEEILAWAMKAPREEVAATLSEAQLAYAASDVLHLHALHERLEAMLAREGRSHLAQACFGFLPYRAELDLKGWAENDIFAHA